MQKFPSPDVLPAPSASVLDRVRYLIALSRKSQAEFGRLLGMDPSAISKTLSGVLKPNEGFINRIVVNLGVSKPWLVRGEGVPFPKSTDPNYLTATPGMVMQAPVKKAAPVYDIDVTAGVTPLSQMFTADNIIGYLDLPHLNPNYPVVRVSGDSMSPRIPDGSLISIREIRDTSILAWGSIYLVQLEDYRLVKSLRRCPSDDRKVILHSDNPDYDDIEVPRDKIIKLFLVESIIAYQTLA